MAYDDDRLRARPYFITAGKTRSDFPLEAMVVARTAPTRALRHERRAIVEEVANPMALVEVGARLSLPLGVVRILVEELADEGWVDIHTESTSADDIDLDTLLRVIDAVKHL
jgi:DNA-binding transcriptional regulator LsrR (DeoR family)